MAHDAENGSLIPGAMRIIPGATRARCLQVAAAIAGLYTVLWLLGFQKFFLNDSEGLATLVQIIGTLYSVLYAFATYVVWGQYTAVENEILKESGALKDLLGFSGRLKESVRDPIVRAVKVYARAVVETEWTALSQGEKSEKMDRLFSEVITSVVGIKPEDDAERSLYQRLLDIANQASVHREERLSLSVKRMPGTVILFVNMTAWAILLLLLLYPFRNVALGIVATALTTALLFFAYFVLTDLDNPFEGTWNVSIDPFGELMTRSR